jgi:hypothetical protein
MPQRPRKIAVVAMLSFFILESPSWSASPWDAAGVLKVSRRPAGTIKLRFRELNSNLMTARNRRWKGNTYRPAISTLGFADQVFLGDGNGNPHSPATNRI